LRESQNSKERQGKERTDVARKRDRKEKMREIGMEYEEVWMSLCGWMVRKWGKRRQETSVIVTEMLEKRETERLKRDLD
jgi:hypothetical protein